MKIKNTAFEKAVARFAKDNYMNPKDLTAVDVERFIKETYPGIKKVIALPKALKLTT